jgi:hypothetical protein
MTKEARLSRKVRLFVGVVIALLLLIGPTIIRWVDSSIPRHIVGQSSRCSIEGRYYPIDFMVVSDLRIAESRAVVRGTSYSLLGPLRRPAPERMIDRELPSDWRPGSPDISSRWQFQTALRGESTAATLEYEDVRLELLLPQGIAVVYNKILELGRNDYGIVIAAGDWKVGPNSYIGFARALCRS